VPPLRDEEIAAIFARLKDEVYGRPPSAGDTDLPSLSVAREEAERLWPVSADRPFLWAPGPWGRMRSLALWPVKTVLRRLMRWYVEPPLADQRRFNAAVLRLFDELSARPGRGEESGPTGADSGA
jgi:hypothetical protein